MFDTSLNKYGCYIANMIHKAIILNGHIHPTVLYIYGKIQPTPPDISHIIAKYVPETNLSLKCHICQLLHVQISNNYVSTYTLYEINVFDNVTMNTGIHTFDIIGICL